MNSASIDDAAVAPPLDVRAATSPAQAAPGLPILPGVPGSTICRVWLDNSACLARSSVWAWWSGAFLLNFFSAEDFVFFDALKTKKIN